MKKAFEKLKGSGCTKGMLKVNDLRKMPRAVHQQDHKIPRGHRGKKKAKISANLEGGCAGGLHAARGGHLETGGSAALQNRRG